MAPSGQAYHVDWIISDTSNVHIANHRDWFTTYTPFKTYCSPLYLPDSRLEVVGIGNVELDVKTFSKRRFHESSSTLITLQNVLYAPGCVCNIFGLLSPPLYSLRFSDNGNHTVHDQTGCRVALVQVFKLPRLRLYSQRGRSSLPDDGAYAYPLDATWPVWPDAERDRWNAHQAGQQSIPAGRRGILEVHQSIPEVPCAEDAPYSMEEETWLKYNFGGEYRFLRIYGLSVDNDEHRAEGRILLRILMLEDAAKINGDGLPVKDASQSNGDGLHLKDAAQPNGNGLQVNYAAKTNGDGLPVKDAAATGSAHDSTVKGEKENEPEDALEDDRYLREREHHRASVDIDDHFSATELVWIRNHYQYSSKFMSSYRLTPSKQEDCDKAMKLIKALIGIDLLL